MLLFLCVFFKQKTAYEMRISDWSSDVCSSDLAGGGEADHHVVDAPARQEIELRQQRGDVGVPLVDVLHQQCPVAVAEAGEFLLPERAVADGPGVALAIVPDQARQRGVLAGQAGEVRRSDRRDEAGEGVSAQQRLLLPLLAPA